MWEFEVRRPFKASLVGGDLPPGQTVIAAVHDASEVEVQAGEVLLSTVKSARDAGTTVTFTRKDTHQKRLYRADAETFWGSVGHVD
jgi:hypothetical protein